MLAPTSALVAGADAGSGAIWPVVAIAPALGKLGSGREEVLAPTSVLVAGAHAGSAVDAGSWPAVVGASPTARLRSLISVLRTLATESRSSWSLPHRGSEGVGSEEAAANCGRGTGGWWLELLELACWFSRTTGGPLCLVGNLGLTGWSPAAASRTKLTLVWPLDKEHTVRAAAGGGGGGGAETGASDADAVWLAVPEEAATRT